VPAHCTGLTILDYRKRKTLTLKDTESHKIDSLLAADYFSKGHYDLRLVIANANGAGRVEKKARQGGMAE